MFQQALKVLALDTLLNMPGTIVIMSDECTDQELAGLLMRHIENPCVEPQTGSNIRQFYIREAERAIATFRDPVAITMLRCEIQKYSPEQAQTA